ncbi:2'-5' RNA ligase family protein [Streptomyces kebangsaanensis]|uniref:2'-5' RNA ligase family protein n=1 Tax=Streptomyces kebangsaanensis TaxID=864058 RepID=UPI001F32230D|nr:2'-5' RNA ligase family protein [Streptomyces kebangsaanensis]
MRLQRRVGADLALEPPLSEDGNLPHVTLFQGPFSDSLAPTEVLADIAASAAGLGLPGELPLSSPGVVYQPTGWLFLALERPALLSALQESVVAVLDPYLDRTAFDTDKDVSRFTDDERISYQKYGYRYVGDAYAPHMTLGRAPEAVALELVRTARERVEPTGTWIFDRLSFYVMGQHGAHAERLAETPLAQR